MPIQKTFRSSVTGRFVSAKFASKHSRTTEGENIRHKKRKAKKK
jgi:hypothetical protein